jgi:hypothetical protein
MQARERVEGGMSPDRCVLGAHAEGEMYRAVGRG